MPSVIIFMNETIKGGETKILLMGNIAMANKKRKKMGSLINFRLQHSCTITYFARFWRFLNLAKYIITTLYQVLQPIIVGHEQQCAARITYKIH